MKVLKAVVTIAVGGIGWAATTLGFYPVLASLPISMGVRAPFGLSAIFGAIIPVCAMCLVIIAWPKHKPYA